MGPWSTRYISTTGSSAEWRSIKGLAEESPYTEEAVPQMEGEGLPARRRDATGVGSSAQLGQV